MSKRNDQNNQNDPNLGELWQSPGMTRRSALKTLGLGAMATMGAAPWLKTWGAQANTKGSNDPAIPIATKDNPLTFPLTSDNPPISSGLSPEKGPLRIYVWSDYLSPAVVKSFEEKYGVKAEVTHYDSISAAMNKIYSGAVRPNVWVPDHNRLPQAVKARLVQPINHSYVPNLSNVISAAADPWYDKGARYSTPNYINTYGCGWRKDLIDIHPGSLKSPWDVYWNVPDNTPIGMLNADPYSTICMTLLHRGLKNFDRVTKDDIFSAMHDLQKLKGLKLQYTCFRPLGLGVEKLAFCYNGDMMQIGHYLPKDTPLTDVQYFFPKNGYGGIIENDMWAINKNAEHPVLGHMFLNHFLELESAIANFRDEGYQTMLKDLTLEKLKAEKIAPPHAIEMAFSPPAYQNNGIPTPIPNHQQLKWFAEAFQQLQSG